MDYTHRFSSLVNGPEHLINLDEAALLMAAHAYPGLDVSAEIARIDALVPADAHGSDLDAWRRLMFVELGFNGDAATFHRPESSYLNEVVRRRSGLPIALSVVGIELARRMGLTLVGVGMPGHFLLRTAQDSGLFVDAFDSGRLLDPDGCRERFHAVNGPESPFRDAYLDPVGPRSVLARMLGNLKNLFSRTGDVDSLRWVLALRMTIPGVPLLERRDSARLKASAGRFVEAAMELEDLAGVLPDHAEALGTEATALRARLN